MESGYVKLFRCLQCNPLWTSEAFSRGQAWVDLLMLANHKETSVRKRGIKIVIGRGQVGWSERNLAERWGWSRGKVKRFLDELEDDHQIEQQNGPQNINVTSLITIVNYDKYQSDEPQNEPEIVPQTDRKRATNSTMNKNEKKVKNKPIDVENEIPEWIPKTSWENFLAMRKRIKKPVGEDSFHIAFSKLKKLKELGNDPGAVLDQSTFNNWQGLFELKDKTETNTTPPATAIMTQEQVERINRAKEVMYGNA
jgi:hypothetical protein